MKRLLFILTILLTLSACGSRGNRAVGDYEILYRPHYAQRFEIGVSGDTTILVVRNPWQGADNVSKQYRFTKPLTRIICMSSSHTAFLEAVDAADQVIGVSGRDFLHSPVMQTKEDVGYDRNLAFEKIVAMKPDAMLVYEIAGENSSLTQKLEQLGIPIIYIADYLEADPLARAEWVVALGMLVGKQAQAERLFESISTKYNTLRDRMQHSALKQPTVMLNSPYRDIWYLPGDSSYMIRLLDDAGSRYLGKGQPSEASRPISIETAYAMLLKADFWLNPSSDIHSKQDLQSLNPNFQKIQASVFSSNARSTSSGGSDFWESGVIHPDVILADLIRIFHPALLPNHKLYYFQELK